MPIPQDILSVPRPKNTVVIAYGKDKSLYAVRQRIGCRNDNGRHLPVNGPTIGHIIDGVYVPIDKEAPDSVSASSVDLKDWANVVLCDRLFSDIRKELSAVYSQTDVMKMYCISILRVCDPGVKNYELKEAYETSFLSELYPGIALSKNTVSTFLNDMGKSVSKIVRFMQNRAAAVSMDHHLLIDGTLKSDESRVNSLSDFLTLRRWSLCVPSAFPETCWMPHPTAPSSRRTGSLKGSSSGTRDFPSRRLMNTLRRTKIFIT